MVNRQRPLVEMKQFACGKEALCLGLVCNSQKMSHQDNPEFLDESSTQQHIVCSMGDIGR